MQQPPPPCPSLPVGSTAPNPALHPPVAPSHRRATASTSAYPFGSRAPPVAYAPGYGATQYAQPASSARTPPQPHSIRSGLRALGQPVPERGGAHTRNAVAQLKGEVAALREALEHQQREYQAALAEREARIASAETLAVQSRAAGADAIAAAQKAAHASAAAQIEAHDRAGAAESALAKLRAEHIQVEGEMEATKARLQALTSARDAAEQERDRLRDELLEVRVELAAARDQREGMNCLARTLDAVQRRLELVGLGRQEIERDDVGPAPEQVSVEEAQGAEQLHGDVEQQFVQRHDSLEQNDCKPKRQCGEPKQQHCEQHGGELEGQSGDVQPERDDFAQPKQRGESRDQCGEQDAGEQDDGEPPDQRSDVETERDNSARQRRDVGPKEQDGDPQEQHGGEPQQQRDVEPAAHDGDSQERQDGESQRHDGEPQRLEGESKEQQDGGRLEG